MGYTIKTTNTAIQDSPPPYSDQRSIAALFFIAREHLRIIFYQVFSICEVLQKNMLREGVEFAIFSLLWWFFYDIIKLMFPTEKTIPMTLLNSYQYFFDYIEDNN